jgi:hypothetical protein
MRDVDIQQAQAEADGNYLARQVRAYRDADDARRAEIIDGAYCDIGFTEAQFLQAVHDASAAQLRRFRPYIDSTRFALTADDVRHDVESGRNRYA